MGIYESVKDAISIVQQVDNIELYRKLLDIQAEMQKMQGSLLEKEQETMTLRREIERLEDALSMKAKLVTHYGAYPSC